ncbi:hypothetical protein AHA02nite_08910 [Alkalibacillus haloalkaliphilus]|uniref:Uncharacterized protein n=1 Tax=Alkalibacillus haloalkaliphilus TaxID=94136 RepID=A0A511W229_9BACI|nr:hypothetical protein AHA02nite_08910 [Alkalibacillus haloalkaliphilus]
MLTRAEMLVVFVLDETISQGSYNEVANGREMTCSFQSMVKLPLKCHSDELNWKQLRWNAVNPTSEQPKLW